MHTSGQEYKGRGNFIRLFQYAETHFKKMVVIYEEMISFDRKDFFQGAKEHTLKIYDFREKILEYLLKELFYRIPSINSLQSTSCLMTRNRSY